jgi:hypothetical protein
MIHITHPMAASVINGFQDTFDTHMVEKRILRLETEATARELLEFHHRHPRGDTLKQFSAQFGSWIDREFRRQITARYQVIISLGYPPETKNGGETTEAHR